MNTLHEPRSLPNASSSDSQTRLPNQSRRAPNGGRPSHDNSKYRVWIFVALLIAAVAGYCASTARQAQVQTPQADDATGDSWVGENMIHLQTVGVMPLDPSRTAYIPHRYTATVVPRRSSRLSFQSAERVVEVLVDAGDEVDEGQWLAQQDDTALAAVAAAAEASLNQAQATLRELIQGPRQETINARRCELNRLKSQMELANVTFRRQRDLFQSGAGSAQEFDRAKYERDALAASVEGASHQLAELEAGTRKEQIAAQQARVAVARAAFDQAAVRLKQTAIFAPFAGRITQRLVDEGSLVQQGTAVLEIIESSALEVRFGVGALIAGRLKKGGLIPFTANGRVYQGAIGHLNPQLDPVTRTREVVVNLSPADVDEVVAGQTVSIEFALPSETTGFWLPSESLRPQVRGLWSVMVLNEQATSETGDRSSAIAMRRDVEVLSTWGAWSRVRGTIRSGDRVIVQGASRITDGQKVRYQDVDLRRPWQQVGARVLADERPPRAGQPADTTFSNPTPLSREAE